MPSFPGSVKTFTNKNTGDVVQASHVNDLQDEVNAIEDGYINGTARLNSSRSTLAALSVTGASTFGSTVTFSSAVDFKGPFLLNSSAGSSGQFLKSEGGSSSPTWGSVLGLNWVGSTSPEVVSTASALSTASLSITGLNISTAEACLITWQTRKKNDASTAGTLTNRLSVNGVTVLDITVNSPVTTGTIFAAFECRIGARSGAVALGYPGLVWYTGAGFDSVNGIKTYHSIGGNDGAGNSTTIPDATITDIGLGFGITGGSSAAVRNLRVFRLSAG